MRCDSSAPIPAIGSSRSISRGFVASTIATSSWRCSPCARFAASTSARALRPTSAEDRVRRIAQARVLAGRPPEPEARPGVRLHRERDVVERGEVAVDAGDLERPREAAVRARRRAERGDVFAGEPDVPAVRPQIAGELADERRLAGAVGADDRVRLAGKRLERDLVGRAQRAERLREVFDVEQDVTHRAPLRAAGRPARAARTAPPAPGSARG